MAEIKCDKMYLHKVEIIESERGYGSKIEDIKYYDDEQEAKDFVAEFNSKNTAKSAPDWYMCANYVGEVLIITTANVREVAISEADINHKLISSMMAEYRTYLESLNEKQEDIQAKIYSLAALKAAVLKLEDNAVAISALVDKIAEYEKEIEENAHMFNRTPEVTVALSNMYNFVLTLIQKNCEHEMVELSTNKATGSKQMVCVHCQHITG